MRLFLLLISLLLTTNLYAKQNKREAAFSNQEKQRIGMLIRSNHFQKPNIKKPSLHNPSTLRLVLNELDPYSKYFSAKEVSFKKKRGETNRLGLGLDLLIDGNLILSIPIKGAPAYQAGFTTAAYLHSINRKKINSSNFDSYSFLVNFSSGQFAEVKTATKEGKIQNKYHVKARPFSQSHVSIRHLKKYSILSIRQFSSNSTAHIKQALKSVPASKPLVIDLRYNPGGDLYATIDTLSFFLKKNRTVAYLNQRNIGTPIPLRTLSGQIIRKKRIYLLLSQFTASSAEIFAQAIKHYLPKTVMIGSATAGKCLAQETHLLENNSAIQLSVYEVLNAKRTHCQNRPLLADIKIKDIETMPLTDVLKQINRLF